MTVLTVQAREQPVWLCFEPWATEYVVEQGAVVVIRFDAGTTVELTHHPEGVTFMSLGRHPDLWSLDGEPLEIFSETMPVTPDVAPGVFRRISEAVPPRPSI